MCFFLSQFVHGLSLEISKAIICIILMSLHLQQLPCECCVDIRSHFSVFSYRLCAIESKVTKVKIDFTIEFLHMVLSNFRI